LERLLEFSNEVIRESYKNALKELLSVYEGKVLGSIIANAKT
jgi:hypothetical protein